MLLLQTNAQCHLLKCLEGVAVGKGKAPSNTIHIVSHEPCHDADMRLSCELYYSTRLDDIRWNITSKQSLKVCSSNVPSSFSMSMASWFRFIIFNPLKSTLPVQGYGGFYGELLLKLSQFLSERHRNYTPRNLEPFSFQIYTVWNKYINKHFVRRIGLVSCTFQSLSEVSAPNDPPISKWQLFIW